MGNIIGQLLEWQYHAHIVIITLGLTILTHLMGAHIFHTPWYNFVFFVGALEFLDVLSHSIMSLFGWED